METPEVLTITPAHIAAVLDLLERAGVPRADTTSGAASIAEMCAGPRSFAFQVDAGGRRVGAYCLNIVDHEACRVAWVQAAAGHLAGVDLTAAVMPDIERRAIETFSADQVAITTRRRALVHKLIESGYHISGITLRKNL